MKTEFKFTDKNASQYVGMILNKEEHLEIYKEGFAKAGEVFGEDSLGYNAIISGISEKDVTGSQFLWNTWLDQLGILPGKVMRLDDWANALSANPDAVSEFYADMPQLILRSDTATWENNQPIINDLSKKLEGKFEYSRLNPLLITGVKLKKSTAKNNPYGIVFDIRDAEIKNDERFSHGNDKINLGIEKNLLTKSTGISRVYLYKTGVTSNNDSLAYSSSDGRVVVVGDRE